ENGPDHQKTFSVGIFLNQELVASGEGTSKQEAQTAAAEAGLDAKQWRTVKTGSVVKKESSS
ncbi:ribonuclease III, partial [Patescibacteria group bacterium]|nr:ribonuclease III [Patescibacteria group bacterium]